MSVAQARGVAPQSKTARARAAAGLGAGEHAGVELPGGEGMGRGGGEDERGGGGGVGRCEEEELLQQHHEGGGRGDGSGRRFGPVPVRERRGAAGGVDEDRAIL